MNKKHVLLPVIIWFFTFAALGGPGSSGGNSYITNTVKDYTFSFAYPTRVQPGTVDIYDFTTNGFVISIEEIAYSESECKATSEYKTVCPRYYDNRVEGIFVMAKKKTFRVIFKSDVHNIEQITSSFSLFALSFTTAKRPHR
ncbi:MAG: hypothetical protein AB7T49_19300 [Oligoflexales bacterium]